MPEFRGGVIPQSITEFGESIPTTRVPEGNYLLALGSMVAGMNRESGEGFISIRFNIAEGPIGMEPTGAGLPIPMMQNPFENTDDPSKSRAWAFGQVLSSLGLPIDQINTLKGKQFGTGAQGWAGFQTFCTGLGTALKGRKMGAVLTDYAGRNGTVSQVARPFTEAEYTSQKSVAGARPPAQAPSNGKAAEPITDAEIQNQLGALLTSPAAV